jgi:hypothetical protein
MSAQITVALGLGWPSTGNEDVVGLGWPIDAHAAAPAEAATSAPKPKEGV